jgi:glycosyltransferase involved in cell wall biosynthesis
VIDPGKPISSLLVTHSPRWNGETEYAFGVIQAGVEMGIKTTVVAPRDCVLARKVAGSVRLLDFPGRDPSSSPVCFCRSLGRLARLIEEGGFDILHACRATAHLLIALAARNRVPLLHLRGGAKKPYGHPGNRLLYRKLTSGVIVSSKRVENWMTGNLKVPPDRVHRILAPVDTDGFRPAPPDLSLLDELKIPRGTPLVLNVARLAPIKGHPVLLEAMAEVRRRIPGSVLVLVGGSFEGQDEIVRRRIGELGLERAVIMTGRRSDISRFLSVAAVCVSSSLGSEENSRAVGEYMAAGRPVAATTVGVIPEMVADGATGRLVPSRDSGALAEAIAALLEDRERAERMGAAGRERAEKEFSRRAFARRLSVVLVSLGIRIHRGGAESAEKER